MSDLAAAIDLAAAMDRLRIAIGETEALAVVTAESYDRQDFSGADQTYVEHLASLLGLLATSARGAMSAYHRLHGALADAERPAGEVPWDVSEPTADGEPHP